jgi:hypothetical protein
MVFLQHRASALEVWGFSDQIDVSDHTAAMFAELRHLIGRAELPGRAKHPVDAETTFSAPSVSRCRPAALVFPAISGERRSTLKATSPSVALRELVPNVLLTAAVPAQAHLDALAQLTQEVPCFSLSTGTDLGYAADCLLGTLG